MAGDWQNAARSSVRSGLRLMRTVLSSRTMPIHFERSNERSWKASQRCVMRSPVRVSRESSHRPMRNGTIALTPHCRFVSQLSVW